MSIKIQKLLQTTVEVEGNNYSTTETLNENDDEEGSEIELDDAENWKVVTNNNPTHII